MQHSGFSPLCLSCQISEPYAVIQRRLHLYLYSLSLSLGVRLASGGERYPSHRVCSSATILKWRASSESSRGNSWWSKSSTSFSVPCSYRGLTSSSGDRFLPGNRSLSVHRHRHHRSSQSRWRRERHESGSGGSSGRAIERRKKRTSVLATRKAGRS